MKVTTHDELVKIMAKCLPCEQREEYVAQMLEMSKNAKKWIAEHPKEEVLIGWPDYALIGPISVAVEEGYVKHNPAGLELLKALWRWDVAEEPTVTMCRATLDLVMMPS